MVVPWVSDAGVQHHRFLTSYSDFVQRLMERFDKRDLEIHFIELAQLKQTDSVEAFVSEFRRVAVMVTDVSESKLVMLFTEALNEPLHGWVKAYKPSTLYERSVEPKIYKIQLPRIGFRLRQISQ